jgi:hypothetical protein
MSEEPDSISYEGRVYVRPCGRGIALEEEPFGSRIRARFAAAGGVELDLPDRSELPRAVSL